MSLDYSYRDYTIPKANDYPALTRVLGSIRYTHGRCWVMDSTSGEYQISPVDDATFRKFINNCKDDKLRLQYSDSTVVAVMPHPPHDRASNYLIRQILHEVDKICHPIFPKAMQSTGCTYAL